MRVGKEHRDTGHLRQTLISLISLPWS
jgi:hypothetical protein